MLKPIYRDFRETGGNVKLACDKGEADNMNLGGVGEFQFHVGFMMMIENLSFGFGFGVGVGAVCCLCLESMEYNRKNKKVSY